MKRLGDAFDCLLDLAQGDDTNNASNAYLCSPLVLEQASPERSDLEDQVSLALTESLSGLFTPDTPSRGTPAPSVKCSAVHLHNMPGALVGHLLECATPDESIMRNSTNGTPGSPLLLTECIDPDQFTMLPVPSTMWWPMLHENTVTQTVADKLIRNAKYVVLTPTQELVDLLNFVFDGSPPTGPIFKSLLEALDVKMTGSYTNKMDKARKAGTYSGCLQLVYMTRKEVITTGLQVALATNKKDPSALDVVMGWLAQLEGKQGVVKGGIEFKAFQRAYNAVVNASLNKLLKAHLAENNLLKNK